MYNHNGSTHGYNTRIVFYPTEDIFIVLLGNNEDLRSAAITCDLEAILFEDSAHLLSFPFPLEKEKLHRFVGVYHSKSGRKRSIELKDNRLFYVNGSSLIELMPLASNSFCFKLYEDYRLTFLDEKTLEVSACSIDPVLFIKE